MSGCHFIDGTASVESLIRIFDKIKLNRKISKIIMSIESRQTILSLGNSSLNNNNVKKSPPTNSTSASTLNSLPYAAAFSKPQLNSAKAYPNLNYSKSSLINAPSNKNSH
jgi:hypothetical protein